MSIVRFINYQNRLAKLIVAPGGKTVDAAVEDAQAELAGVADACLAEIDRLLAVLVERSASLAKPAGKEDVLYSAAREIAGLGAIARRPHLGQAAHSLCVLVDETESTGRWRADAAMVHVSTLQLLRTLPNEDDPAVPEQLVGSLTKMVKRLIDENARAG